MSDCFEKECPYGAQTLLIPSIKDCRISIYALDRPPYNFMIEAAIWSGKLLILHSEGQTLNTDGKVTDGKINIYIQDGNLYITPKSVGITLRIRLVQ